MTTADASAHSVAAEVKEASMRQQRRDHASAAAAAAGSSWQVSPWSWSTAAARSLLAVALLLGGAADACSPGRTAMSRYSSPKSTPLVFKQYVPNREETSLPASGSFEGAIKRDSPRFKDLVENYNLDIVFRDEENSGADRLMSQRCKDKLNSLAVMVMNQWPGVKLRVTEAWDEDGEHASDSLHYEGRAVDLTTSDKDKSKLGMLARLAIDAGFDYVYYESRTHIHCSVKSDKSLAVGSGGCFSGSSTVVLADGTRTTMENLRIGDRVLAADSEGRLFFDEVYTFLDQQRHAVEDYYVLQTEGNVSISVTGTHLLFVLPSSDRQYRASGEQAVHPTVAAAMFARDVVVGDSLYVAADHSGRNDQHTGQQMLLRKVTSTAVRRRRGMYAPATMGGTVVVDDVLASCYAVVNSHGVAHAALSPLRLAHRVRQAAASWLRWLTDANDALSHVDNLPSSSDGGVHWYAQTLYAATRSLAGDVLFK